MCTADEKFFTPLSASEYRLLDILCLLSKDNVATPTMEELARYAQSSEESIRRALRKLEEVELIKVERTRRNLGKLYRNQYHLISPSHKNVDEESVIHKNEDAAIHKNVGSTAGTSVPSTTVTTNKVNKTTSYLVPKGTNGRKEFILVNRWSDDDGGVKGFGLFDDEVASKAPSAKVSKRDPKTRNLRPKEEWTAADVASEFASRLYKTIPGVPNLVNTSKVRGALSKMRVQYDSNALIELEIMEMFFEDPWVSTKGKENPAWLAGRFLKMFANNFDQALKNLGLPPRQAPSETSTAIADYEEFIFASDGKRFDNSMAGRIALERYEERIQSGLPNN